MAIKDFNKWIKISIQMTAKLPNISPLKCPMCEKDDVRILYTGDKETRIGCLDVWCNSCFHGIHISRAKVPETADNVVFRTDWKETLIPNYKKIVP